MRQMRSRISAAILAPDYGRTLAPGQVVDLDEALPAGGTLADLVRADWFDPVPVADPEPMEARQRLRRVPAAPLTPDGPALED